MSYLQTCCLVLTLFIIDTVQSGRVCDFSSDKCATQAAKHNFKLIVAGIPGVFTPLGALSADTIEGETPTLKYLLTKPTLDGFNNCDVEHLSLNLQELTYVYAFQCPYLVLSSEFTAKGILGPINVDHEGSFNISAENYNIVFEGKYKKYTDEKDNKLRIIIESHNIKTEPKGKITFQRTSLSKGDVALDDALQVYFNENWQSMEKQLRSPTLDILLSKFIDSINGFLKYFPVDVILAEEN